MLENMMIALGITGTGLVVGMYLLLQVERISAKSLWFSFWNGLGAAMIFTSIAYDFDPADTGGLLVEGAWMLVSVYGLARGISGWKTSVKP